MVTNLFEILYSVFSSFLSLSASVLASSLSSCLENFAKTFLNSSNALAEILQIASLPDLLVMDLTLEARI